MIAIAKPILECTDILLLGDRRQTLTVIRSLACLGYRITIGQTDGERYGAWSRYCSEAWTHPVIEGDGSRFIESLNWFLHQNPQITLLFPIGDTEIRTLSQHRDALPDHVRVVMPTREIVELCHDKVAMCRIVDETGVLQAPFEVVVAGQELARAAERIGYPCIIRPQDQFVRWRGEKVIICHTPADVANLDSDPFVKKHDWMVQQYVIGLRHNFYGSSGFGVLFRNSIGDLMFSTIVTGVS